MTALIATAPGATVIKAGAKFLGPWENCGPNYMIQYVVSGLCYLPSLEGQVNWASLL